MKKLLLAAFSLSLMSYVANAQTLDESFEYYGAGNLAGQGYWVDNPKYVAGDPITVGAPGLNGNLAIHMSPGASNGSGPIIPFADGGKLTKNATSGVVYISFLVKLNAAPSSTADNYFFYLADMSANPVSTDGRGRLYVRAESDDAGAKIAFGAIASSNSTADLNYTGYNYEVGKTYLIIEKYEKNSETDRVSLWVFDQTVTGGETTPDYVSLETESVSSKKEISGVGLRRMNGSFDIIIDDIKADIVWAGVSGTNVPLPVNLTSFTATVQNNAVKLNWATASEQNNSHFEVLRSGDGKSFSTLGTVSGNGNSQAVHNYSYVDANPVSGTNYYQLRQIDFDGKAELSKVVAVKTDLSQTELSVHASPANAYVKVSVTALTDGPASIVITDVQGVQVAEQNVQLSKGYNVLQVPVQTAPGVYVLTLKTGTAIKRVKFISQ